MYITLSNSDPLGASLMVIADYQIKNMRQRSVLEGSLLDDRNFVNNPIIHSFIPDRTRYDDVFFMIEYQLLKIHV